MFPLSIGKRAVRWGGPAVGCLVCEVADDKSGYLKVSLMVYYGVTAATASRHSSLQDWSDLPFLFGDFSL